MTTVAKTFSLRQSFPEKARSQPVIRDTPDTPIRPPKLMDRLHEAFRSRHYSRRTGQASCRLVKRFIYFHHIRHPAEMAEPEINAFLTHLEKVASCVDFRDTKWCKM